jgi:hypothetical protein
MGILSNKFPVALVVVGIAPVLMLELIAVNPVSIGSAAVTFLV